MRYWKRWALIAVAIGALIATGCASKKYVRTEMEGLQAATDVRIEDVQTQVEANQTAIVENDAAIEELSVTTQEALDRAIAAGKLAEGKFLYETVLTDDLVRFSVDSAELPPDGMSALATFSEELASRNENVFVEVQGHTDSTGSEAHNLALGERRAMAVQRYLNRNGGVPLHRMSVISYGESQPIADESTQEGRALNRRVTLVVLK